MDIPTIREPATSPPPAAPPKGLKKVLSKAKAAASRTSVSDADTASQRGGVRSSVDSTGAALDRENTRTSEESSRDGSSRSGSGIAKLLPSHRRRKKRAELEQAADEDHRRGRTLDTTGDAIARASGLNQDESTLDLAADNTSLLTDDSDTELRPPLATHESHAGYLTSSSPLITTTTVGDNTVPVRIDAASSTSVKSTEPSTAPSTEPPTRTTTTSSLPAASDSASDLTSPFQTKHASTLGALGHEQSQSRRGSIAGSLRGISPGRKLKEAFVPQKSDKSPRTSPERSADSATGTGKLSGLLGNVTKKNSISARRASRSGDTPPAPVPVLRASSSEILHTTNSTLPAIDTNAPPKTPPGASIATPFTTVTPPTPTDLRSVVSEASPKLDSTEQGTGPSSGSAPGVGVVSSSGNMISHRRVRSTSAVGLPSKLSNATSAPLTPTIEESRTPSGSIVPGSQRPSPASGGFFSSVFSAAQNAATNFSNTINTQSRARSGTQTSDPEKVKGTESSTEDPEHATEEEPAEKRELAIDTLGQGELNFAHLGLETASMAKDGGESIRSDTGTVEARKEVSLQRDEASARVEDVRAARAVSAAYEKGPDQLGATPMVEDLSNYRNSQTFSNLGGEHTPPNGSLYEGEPGQSIKRSGSVRSRLAQRRHRGSSGATGGTIGAMIGASTATLANPATGPRLTGFVFAPKQRNRNFHQLFRSVPEDDYLIEDYSCALQRDILLAGRIYISEGHICFSSNILGWVTTLVISFEEVMSIEKETTAMVFPNAIAIQTLHARHTFRSLLSRESTYDLVIGIWKVSHPGTFKSSQNGLALEQGSGDKTEKSPESEIGSDDGSEDDEDVYDEDAEDDGAGSFVDTGEGSVAGSDKADSIKPVSRKPSAMGVNGAMAGSNPPYPSFGGDVKAGERAVTTTAADSVTFPGPTSHPPTECADGPTHYEKVLVNEVIACPLGRIYSMLFGPTSGAFLSKYLVDEQRVLDLQLEDDKKGISDEVKSRTYSYVKPLNASIGPKQTKCIVTESMDAFDLEKAVSVTMTTQTPDVPSGNVFSVKTKYCLSWGPGNGTRVNINCGIEWTGKSWLKGPIEKGANDGQIAYANDLAKALKAGMSARPRAATSGSRAGRTGKTKKKKGDGSKSPVSSVTESKTKQQEANWGLLDPLRGPLGPIVDMLKPLWASNVTIGVIGLLLIIMWYRGSSRAPSAASGLRQPAYSTADRISAYEEMWRQEESELWAWMDDRIGMEGLSYPAADISSRKAGDGARKTDKEMQRERKKILGGKDAAAKMREEKMSEREVEDAIRVTQERLDVLRHVVAKKKGPVGKTTLPAETPTE